MSHLTLPEQPVILDRGHWTDRGFKIANVIGGMTTVAFAGTILLATQHYAFRVGPLPGPGMFPTVISVCLLALGAAWTIGALLDRYQVDAEVEPPPDRSALIRAASSFAVVLLSAFGMQTLGYPLTMAASVFVLTLLGGGRWRAALVAGPIFAMGTFLLVTTVLGIQLPAGLLRPILIHLL